MPINYTCPVFIVGPPRSGTTLLQKLLIENFMFGALPETHFYSNIVEYIEREGALLKLHRKTIRERAFVSIPDEFISGKSRKEVFESYVNILSAVYDKINQNIEVRLLEKTPEHAFMLQKIFEDYPDAKVVFILRDPLETILSAVKNFSDRFGVLSYRQRVIKWRECVKILFFYVQSANVKFVKYEDFVKNYDKDLLEICNWLNVPRRTIPISACNIRESIILPEENWKSSSFEKVSVIQAKYKIFSELLFVRVFIDLATLNERRILGYRRANLVEKIYDSILFFRNIFRSFEKIY